EEVTRPEDNEDIVGGSETILLVEDEAAFLRMGKTMLEGLGYRVLFTSSPTEALRVAQHYEHPIDMLITDVIMPEMNGRALAEKVQVVHPELTSLYMSGYTANVIAHRGVLDEGVHFMQKPFSLKKLASKVREVLDE
ncbi:response regulator, partial [bacterium]|nr:response regulator [bacterium]